MRVCPVLGNYVLTGVHLLTPVHICVHASFETGFGLDLCGHFTDSTSMT